MLTFVTKKNCKICLSFHLINFEYTLLLILSTPLALVERSLYPSSFTSSEVLLNMTKFDENDGSLDPLEYRRINEI